MKASSRLSKLIRSGAVGVAAAAACYGACAAASWYRYGRARRAVGAAADPLLDGFMPSYDVVERHSIRVAAPAATTFEAATQLDLLASPVARAMFKARELVLRSRPAEPLPSRALLEQAQAIGWRVLTDVPGREVVFGAATQPWKANPVFRPIAPEAFEVFDEPEHVKIAWTVRAEPAGPTASIFRTETRVVSTDRAARRRFRRYWAFVSPGIVLIRLAMLRQVKAEAERRVAATGAAA